MAWGIGSSVCAVVAAIGIAAAPAGAHHPGDASHLWQDHLKPMGDPGTINEAGNPVHWTKLKGVPAGWADGADGGITKAGFGLGVILNSFNVISTSVQRRVTGACPSTRAIQSVAESGSVTCGSGLAAFSSFSDDTGVICNDGCVEGVLELPPGTYAIFGKFVLNQHSWEDDELIADCTLAAGDDTDHLQISADRGAILPISLQVSHTFESAGRVTIACTDHDIGDVHGENLKITAISLGDLTTVGL